MAWGGGAVKCGDRLPRWRLLGGGRGGRRRGRGGGTVGGSATFQSVSVALGGAPAERRSAAPRRVWGGPAARTPGARRHAAGQQPAHRGRLAPPRRTMPICERAGRLERAGGTPRRPRSTRVGLTATPPSTLLECGGGRGRRGRLGEAVLGGGLTRRHACRVPATGPASRRLGGQRARPSRHTSPRALWQQHRGGGGGDGPRLDRRGGRGRVGCGQRRMRPRSLEFHCQSFPPPLSVVAAGAAHLPLGRVPAPVGRSARRSQSKPGAQATAHHPSPRVIPVAGGWTGNVAAPASISAPSAGPRGHAPKWHALLPPPPPRPPLSPPSLLPPPQPQRQPLAWDSWRRSASPPPRVGSPDESRHGRRADRAARGGARRSLSKRTTCEACDGSCWEKAGGEAVRASHRTCRAEGWNEGGGGWRGGMCTDGRGDRDVNLRGGA